LNFFKFAVLAESKSPQFVSIDALKVKSCDIEKQHINLLLEKRQGRLRNALLDIRLSIGHMVHHSVDFFEWNLDAVVFFQQRRAAPFTDRISNPRQHAGLQNIIPLLVFVGATNQLIQLQIFVQFTKNIANAVDNPLLFTEVVNLYGIARFLFLRVIFQYF